MLTALIIFICIICVLLILVVLIQNSKGGGLTSEMGGLGSNQLMGVKKTTDLLEQVTWGFGMAVMLLSLVSFILIDRNATSGINSVNVDRAQTQTLPGAAAPMTAPATPGAVAPGAATPGASTPGAATPGSSASALRP